MNPPIPPPDGSFAAPPFPPNMEGDTTGGIIPYKNPHALLAYYIGLFSILPVLGLVMGPIATILGVKGLKYAKQHPVVKGHTHAYVGIACGIFWSIIHWGVALMLLIGMAGTRVAG